MATVLKRRRLVNPGKRRKMSAKQIRFFGTKAQRAALKRRYKNPKLRKTIKTINKVKRQHRNELGVTSASKRLISRIRKVAKSKKRSKKVRNIGEIFSIGLNPSRRTNMKKRKHSHKARRRTSGRIRNRRRNPHYVKRIKRGHYMYANPGRKRRRNPGRRRNGRRYARRNPGFSGSGIVSLAKTSLEIIAGAVGARAVTQMILGAKNTGAMGYAANAIVAFGLGMLASKVMKNKGMGAAITAGGMTGLVLRLLQDLTPVGQYVNLQLAGLGRVGDVGMGAIVPTTFFVPTNYGPDMVTAQLPAAVAALAAPPAKMSGIGKVVGGGRYSRGGRYN